jgi:hypothetical protein
VRGNCSLTPERTGAVIPPARVGIWARPMYVPVARYNFFVRCFVSCCFVRICFVLLVRLRMMSRFRYAILFLFLFDFFLISYIP